MVLLSMAWYFYLSVLGTSVLTGFQWPYTYDSCDVGTLPRQVHPGTQTPLAAVENGDPGYNNVLVRIYPPN
jgi:hypothetical protein